MTNIKLLNPVSPVWRDSISENEYTLDAGAVNPDAIIVRSADMHSYDLEDTVIAVARAGVGVNNIPLDAYAEKGVVVFNSPGANANAVKELVISALLLASRDITGGWQWASGLKGEGENVEKLVEKGKKAFVGPEIAGKTLGVIGLGAIGILVANAANALGMKVLGYDPYISVDHAWQLSRSVQHAMSEEEVIEKADYLTLHIPLNDKTRNKFDKAMIAKMKKGAALVNFARGELCETDAVIEALENGQLRKYICDFPTEKLLGVKNAICLPHIGASTPESEDNCVRMVASQLDAYLKTGAIKNSVNYPEADPGRLVEPRLIVLHQNVPNVVSSITSLISACNINIENMLNKSRGKYAYTCLDLDQAPDAQLIKKIEDLETVYRVRVLIP
ncbi:MAG: phosphoglycerate dehydrogenase [Clostridia bacterium]|nr:phosphoglycerate dehydrogenase [Clostridia bacterium]MBQ4620716.1 phosphoglycerate dehydrogenase [Clostridia bacterium]